MIDIPSFLRGFAKPASGPIKVGDKVKHKDTGIYSTVKSISNGLVYGETENGLITIGKFENMIKL